MIYKISRDKLRKIVAAARREIDLEDYIGIDRKNQVYIDRRKKQDRDKCRKKIEDDE